MLRYAYTAYLVSPVSYESYTPTTSQWQSALIPRNTL
jgi:hypothetical protein